MSELSQIREESKCPEHKNDATHVTEASFVLDEESSVTVGCRRCTFSKTFTGAKANRVLTAGASYWGFVPMRGER